MSSPTSTPRPAGKKQMSASKIIFPSYFDWLKNLQIKVAEIQKYIDDNNDVPLSADQANTFQLMKEQVAAYEKDAPKFGKNWSRFSSSQSESKASQLYTRLSLYKDNVQNTVKTTRQGIQAKLERLQEEIDAAGKSTTAVVLAMKDSDHPGESKEYTIEVELRAVNRGAFGTLHIGKCVELGREFALKRPILLEEESGTKALNADTTRRFLREGSIWSKLKHKHILPYVGKVELGDTLYLVSPYIRDGDLLTYLRNNPSTSKPQILHDIASALAYMHAQDPPVIHADVKSGNILIDSTGHTYICDFGLTKLGDAVTTMKGVGTLYWLSPERLDGGGWTRTAEDDVYAFGITIAEVVLGRVPYDTFDGTDTDFKTGVMWRDVRPEGGSGPLWDLACRCWQHDPKLRPTMAEVTAELLSIVEKETS